MATVPVEISLEFTPNPDSLKYVLNRTILEKGTEYFTDAEEAARCSPLASKLFDLGNIGAVMIGPSFITVTLTSQQKMSETNLAILETIKAHLESGEMVVTPRAKKPITAEDSETVRKIQEVLDNDIRPAIAMDGGDVSFEDYRDGVVYLYMQGACSGCPSAAMTLKMGIETRLREVLPDIREVVQV